MYHRRYPFQVDWEKLTDFYQQTEVRVQTYLQLLHEEYGNWEIQILGCSPGMSMDIKLVFRLKPDAYPRRGIPTPIFQSEADEAAKLVGKLLKQEPQLRAKLLMGTVEKNERREVLYYELRAKNLREFQQL